MTPRITITDLARITGFSKTTISHVVNNTKGARIRPETRELIQKAAQEHNYVPNFFARNIIRGRTRFLGFLTHDLDRAGRSGELLGAEEACRAGGYRLLLANAGQPDVSESQMIEGLVQQGIEGLYADWFENPAAALERFQQFGIHLVLGQKPEDGAATDCVFNQTRDGLNVLGEKLRQLGHSSLLLISTGAPSEKRILAIARETFRVMGLSVGEILTEGCDLSSDLGWIESSPAAPSPTALVCLDESLGLGILTNLLFHGKRPPSFVSMAVAGATAGLGREKPRLACLSLRVRERASCAVERLIERAEGKTVEQLPYLSLGLAPSLFEGESLGPAAPRASS